jgi:hypothetical protein
MVSERMTLQVLGTSEDAIVVKGYRLGRFVYFDTRNPETCLRSTLAYVVLMLYYYVGLSGHSALCSNPSYTQSNESCFVCW